MRLLPLLLLLALTACASSPQPTALVDDNLRRDTHAGRSAYMSERPKEAAAAYRAALKQAQARDDLPAIADLGYNLAVAQLRANQPGAALDTARTLRAEITRRGGTPLPELDFVEATALYRVGNVARADALAVRLETGGSRDIAASAAFLRGLIADDHGDEAGLQAAVRALATPTTPEQTADAAELQARLLLRRNDAASARLWAERAAALRRDRMDYRGLARALAVEASAAAKAGDAAAAADLYLRAGRSAAAEGDNQNARSWLRRVVTARADPAVTRAARELLTGLDAGS